MDTSESPEAAAWTLYSLRDFAAAARLYERLSREHEAQDRIDRAAHCAYMHATCMVHLAQYTAATASYKVVASAHDSTSVVETHRALAGLTNVAACLPLGRKVVLAALRGSHDFLSDANQSDRRDKLLLIESRYELRRGELRRALDLAQEAWSVYQVAARLGLNDHSFVDETYVAQLVTCSAALGDADGIRRYRDLYGEYGTGSPSYRRMVVSAADAEIALVEHEIGAAVESAHLSFREALPWIGDAESWESLRLLVSVYLVAGQPLRALATLVSARRMRRSESAYARFLYLELSVRARLLCLVALDDQTTSTRRIHECRIEALLRSALRLAVQLDDLFDSTWYSLRTSELRGQLEVSRSQWGNTSP